MYVAQLQLQFRGINIIYQYHIEGRRIKNTDEALLHSTLGFMELVSRRKKHLLQMMYILKLPKPELVEKEIY